MTSTGTAGTGDERAEYGYRVPSGRRPDPSSFDPELTTVGQVIDDASLGPGVDDGGGVYPAARLQPGTRLRVGPRHGSGGRRSEEPAAEARCGPHWAPPARSSSS